VLNSRHKSSITFLVLLYFTIHSSQIHAAEYQDVERTAVENALEDMTATELEFNTSEAENRLLPGWILGKRSEDAHVNFNFRVYDFRRKTFDAKEASVLAAGGNLAITSGRIWETVSVGLTYSISQELKTGQDEVPTGILPTGEERLSVLSEGYLRLDHPNRKSTKS
jgi:hypothetical protein